MLFTPNVPSRGHCLRFIKGIIEDSPSFEELVSILYREGGRRSKSEFSQKGSTTLDAHNYQ